MQHNSYRMTLPHKLVYLRGKILDAIDAAVLAGLLPRTAATLAKLDLRFFVELSIEINDAPCDIL